ncbi:MAG: hypothetical protein IPK97_01320 [Ahniella sp.]|nr:hypothetical protein [Ahniella sp.]
MNRLILTLALTAAAFAATADDNTANTETRSEAAAKVAPTGSRIQRLPDITVIPGAVGRHAGAADARARKPQQADEQAFLDGKA